MARFIYHKVLIIFYVKVFPDIKIFKMLNLFISYFSIGGFSSLAYFKQA